MQIDLSGALEIVKNVVVNENQKTLFTDAISFTIIRFRLEVLEADKKSYEQYKNHKENVSNKITQVQRALSRCNNEEKNIMFSGIRDKLNMGFPDAQVAKTILDFLQENIKMNTKSDKWKGINGSTPKTKTQRILIARIAGIYSVFGGNDSHSENSVFIKLLRCLFSIIGINGEPVPLLKRAKEQNYYNHFKANPFPVGSFYYDLADIIGTNNQLKT
jgi:hypothetical protein